MSSEKTCKKRLSTKEERSRQALRTEGNKARRAKARAKWLAKRRKKASTGLHKGASFTHNQMLRADAAEAHTIRRIVTKNGNLTVESKPSIGLLKQREGTPTNWKMPHGWQASPEAK